MVGATRSTSGGSFNLTAMGSLETITWGDCGYPRVLSAGAACGRDGFHEYQHPHPPLMELSGRLLHGLRGDRALELYAALIGEPALGPPSYVHRASATHDPIAPIAHHELNPAHTSAGVLTAGLVSGTWKLEASVFNGEPADHDRVIQEFRALRSVSARAQFAPTPAWSVQVSAGRVRSGEAHHPGASPVLRVVTASAMHVRPQAVTQHATTLAWTRMDDGILARHSLLLESTVTFAGRWTCSVGVNSRIAQTLVTQSSRTPTVRTTISQMPVGRQSPNCQPAPRSSSVSPPSRSALAREPRSVACRARSCRSTANAIPRVSRCSLTCGLPQRTRP
jgi:hypothetical protein